jgi:hypothetical protein
MVPMHVSRTLELFMNRGSSNVAAAGLRHSRGPWKGRFMVPMRIPRTLKLSAPFAFAAVKLSFRSSFIIFYSLITGGVASRINT